MQRLFEDLSYICGLTFISFERYLGGGNSDQKSEVSVVGRIKQRLWREVHDDMAAKHLEERRYERFPDDGKLYSILKSSDKYQGETPANRTPMSRGGSRMGSRQGPKQFNRSGSRVQTEHPKASNPEVEAMGKTFITTHEPAGGLD